MRKLILWSVLSILITAPLNVAFAQSIIQNPSNPIMPVKSWTELLTHDGVKIEYRFKKCDSGSVRNQYLVLFRYSNLTLGNVKFDWTTEVYRDAVCVNCHRIDNPEYSHSLTLAGGEVVEGDGLTKTDKRLYLFANFIELVPGMSNQKLTGFNFINLSVTAVN